MTAQQRNALVLFLAGLLFDGAGFVLLVTSLDSVMTFIVFTLSVLLMLLGAVELALSRRRNVNEEDGAETAVWEAEKRADREP